MDHIWSPWRYSYIKTEKNIEECVFCSITKHQEDDKDFVLYRAKFNYIVLNIFPYVTGHLLIIPYIHTAILNELDLQITNEMMDLTKYVTSVLTEEYKPEGCNIGMNLGKAAGAGIPDHLHMHVLPRWFGDVNFCTTIAETRILPETLGSTYQRLLPYFNKLAL